MRATRVLTAVSILSLITCSQVGAAPELPEWFKLKERAAAAKATGDYVQEEAYARQAADMLKPGEPAKAICLNIVAMSQERQGKLNDAAETIGKEISIYFPLSSTWKPSIADAVEDLADVQDKLEQHKDAQESYEHAAQLYSDSVGSRSPEVADNMVAQGKHYYDGGDMANAEKSYRKAIEIYDENFGPGLIETGIATAGLAQVFVKQDKPEADETCQKALEIYKAWPDADADRQFAQVQEAYIGYLNQHGKQADAAKIDADTRRNRTRVATADGIVEMRKGNCDKAIEKFQKALSIDPSNKWAQENLSIAFNNRACDELEASKMKEGETDFGSALDISKANLGGDNEQTLQQLQNLAVLQEKVGKFKEAKESLEKVVSAREKDDSANKEQLAAAYISLANADRSLGNVNESDEQSKKSTNILSSLSSTPSDLGTKTRRQNPRPSTEPSNESTGDYSAYMADLQHSIKANWHPPKESTSKSCAVTFSIHHGGQLSHVRLDRPSGEDTVDKAAISAVHDSTPLSALPSANVPKVFISFTFDYNVHPKNSDGSSATQTTHHSGSHALGGLLRTLPYLPIYVP